MVELEIGDTITEALPVIAPGYIFTCDLYDY